MCICLFIAIILYKPCMSVSLGSIEARRDSPGCTIHGSHMQDNRRREDGGWSVSSLQLLELPATTGILRLLLGGISLINE